MEHEALHPSPWMMIPFGVLLATIALAPLFFPGWWGRHYPKAAYALGAITLTYYLGFLGDAGRVRALHTGIEYVSFICLIGSLFVVSGGIHITVKGEATPMANVIFLAIGSVIANVLGTTGASMLLIRPWIRMNKYRITAHHIVFFIFTVSNVGGCLTPIGDPPLFLGYLKGIPFWWVAEQAGAIWLTALVILLGIFYVLDTRNFLRAPARVRDQETAREEWRFEGLPNLLFLAIILGSVFINHPPFLREGLMLLAAIGSYFTTQRRVHQANDFNFHPIQEVAILFVGIFATMMPALDFLQHEAGVLAKENLQLFSPTVFYWGTGTLSSLLDNAPTYLSFLSAELGAFVSPELTRQVVEQVRASGADVSAISGPNATLVRETIVALARYYPAEVTTRTITEEHLQLAVLLGHREFARGVLAISVAAVFFGANTYIGNGPNFMVKAIADQQKVNTPTFLGYVFRFTLPYMLPMLLIIWALFFRN
jgi:Na+/H+ antiporter NhaD/arsenite permease-like protein